MTSVRKRGCTWELVNWAGAVARVLNGEDGLASLFSCPIDPCSGGATGAQLSLLHHYTITLISISPASGTRPCDSRAHGDELVRSVRQKHEPDVSLGGLRTFSEFLLSVVLRRDAARSWQVGSHRSASSPGSGGLLLWRGSSLPHHLLQRVCARGSGSWTGGSEGLPRSVENKISGVEAESGKALYYLSWILYNSL